jgi:hypothetical protein
MSYVSEVIYKCSHCGCPDCGKQTRACECEEADKRIELIRWIEANRLTVSRLAVINTPFLSPREKRERLEKLK